MDKLVEGLLKVADLAEVDDFTLGALAIHPARRLIAGPSGPVLVEPRVMQLLVALSEAETRVLTRDALIRRCWGGVYVAEESLNRAVSELRRAVREAGDDPAIVETVPRVGYRLALAPSPLADPAQAAPATEAAPATKPATVGPAGAGPVSRRLMLGAALAATAAGGALLYRATRPDPAQKLADSLVAEAEQALVLETPEKEMEALALFERAAHLQPDRAALWGKLALARAQADEHADPDSAVAPASAVMDASRRAHALDPDDIDAHAALALLQPIYGDWLAAERRFEAVLARDPGHLATQESLCFLLGAVGRMRETATRRIAMNGPGTMRPSMQCRVAFCYWFLGRIEEADRVLGRAAEMWPGNHSVWIFRFFILSGTGRFERALAHVTDPAGRPPLPPPMIEGLRLSTVAALSGTEADRARAVEALMPRLRESPAAVVNALMLLNLIGAIDAAFDVADAYFLERGPLIAALRWRPGGEIQINSSRRKTNPLFVPSSAPMRTDPRFGPLTEAMGLGRYWRERGIEPDFRRLA